MLAFSYSSDCQSAGVVPDRVLLDMPSMSILLYPTSNFECKHVVKANMNNPLVEPLKLIVPVLPARHAKQQRNIRQQPAP